MKNHWLSLEAVLRSLPTIANYSVSEVARGIKSSNQTNEGFVEAYIATKGSPDKMAQRLTGRNDHETWADRRIQFNTRHYGQVKKNKEKLWQKNGDPTRRHLGLIAWGWSPAKEHKRLEKWLVSQPTMESGEWKKYVGARRNLRKNKIATGYQSYAWISQDWRSVFIHKDRISYDKKCGAKERGCRQENQDSAFLSKSLRNYCVPKMEKVF